MPSPTSDFSSHQWASGSNSLVAQNCLRRSPGARKHSIYTWPVNCGLSLHNPKRAGCRARLPFS